VDGHKANEEIEIFASTAEKKRMNTSLKAVVTKRCPVPNL